MNESLTLDLQVRSTQERLQQIRQQIAMGGHDRDKLLSEAIDGLSSSLEELAVTTEKLHQQNEALVSTRQGLEWERQRYQNLFNFAPDAYLVTDESGVIEEINEAAAALLNIRRDFGIGRPLILYVAQPDHPLIDAQLEQAAQSTLLLAEASEICTILVQDQEVSLQPSNCAAVPTLLD
jgi:PAS domain-containing protein